MIVEWRRVPGLYGDYEVTNIGGRVRRATAGRGTFVGRELRRYIWRDCNGYRQVLVCLAVPRSSGKRGGVRVRVSRLVLAAYARPPHRGELACHKDDNSLVNDAANLEWGRHSKNLCQAWANGRRKVG